MKEWILYIMKKHINKYPIYPLEEINDKRIKRMESKSKEVKYFITESKDI